MSIYKQKQIERYASELLVKDFNENPGFIFTNISYLGPGGEVYGTIEKRTKLGDNLIQYYMQHEWNDKSYRLIRRTVDTIYRTKDHDEIKKINEEIIKEFYLVSDRIYDRVFTDDEIYAISVGKKRAARYDINDYNRKNSIDRTERTIQSGTKLYDRLFTYAANYLRKPLKYGTKLTYEIVRKYNCTNYNFNTNRYDTGLQISSYVTVVYRKQEKTVLRRRIFIKRGIIE